MEDGFNHAVYTEAIDSSNISTFFTRASLALAFYRRQWTDNYQQSPQKADHY